MTIRHLGTGLVAESRPHESPGHPHDELLQFIRVDGRIRLVGSDSATQIANLPGRFSGSGLAAARVNWRDILE